MDFKQVGSALNTIAYGDAMMAAIKDYTKELAEEEEAGKHQSCPDLDIDDLLDDPELEKLHADRLAAMKQEAERRAQQNREGYGTYTDISEGEFLEVVTKAENVVCHFYHRDFERCKIIDAHLAPMCKRFMETRFIKVSAPDAPFFTVKLGIRVLPCIVLFKHGRVVSKIVGFDQLGGKDDFSTASLEKQLHAAGLTTSSSSKAAARWEESDKEEEEPDTRSSIRTGFHNNQKTASDEDSDFE